MHAGIPSAIERPLANLGEAVARMMKSALAEYFDGELAASSQEDDEEVCGEIRQLAKSSH
jgi:hypothetical protein